MSEEQSTEDLSPPSGIDITIGNHGPGKSIGDFIRDHLEEGNVIIQKGKVFKTEKGKHVRSLQEIPLSTIPTKKGQNRAFLRVQPSAHQSPVTENRIQESAMTLA